jgi:hypothetical protein
MTLLIQRDRSHPSSSGVLPMTPVRVTRYWSLMGLMLDFGYSTHSNVCVSS